MKNIENTLINFLKQQKNNTFTFYYIADEVINREVFVVFLDEKDNIHINKYYTCMDEREYMRLIKEWDLERIQEELSLWWEDINEYEEFKEFILNYKE